MVSATAAIASTPLLPPQVGITVTGQGGTTARLIVSRPTNVFVGGSSCISSLPGGPGKWGGLLLHRDGDVAAHLIGRVVVNGVSGNRCTSYAVGLGSAPSRLEPGRYTAILLGTGKQTFSLGTDRESRFPLLRTSAAAVPQQAFYKSESWLTTWDAPIDISARTAVFTMWSARSDITTASAVSACLVPAGAICSHPPSVALKPNGDEGNVDPQVTYYRSGALSAGRYVFQGRAAGPSNLSAFSLALGVPA